MRISFIWLRRHISECTFVVLHRVGVTTHIAGPGIHAGRAKVRNPYTLTWTESRTHFAAWCIVSSPLVLGLDLTNETNMDLFWPIITNHEALAVNEAWVGDAGSLLKQSTEMARMP